MPQNLARRTWRFALTLGPLAAIALTAVNGVKWFCIRGYRPLDVKQQKEDTWSSEVAYSPWTMSRRSPGC